MLRSGTAAASLNNESLDPEGSAPVGGTTVRGLAKVLATHADIAR